MSLLLAAVIHERDLPSTEDKTWNFYTFFSQWINQVCRVPLITNRHPPNVSHRRRSRTCGQQRRWWQVAFLGRLSVSPEAPLSEYASWTRNSLVLLLPVSQFFSCGVIIGLNWYLIWSFSVSPSLSRMDNQICQEEETLTNHFFLSEIPGSVPGGPCASELNRPFWNMLRRDPIKNFSKPHSLFSAVIHGLASLLAPLFIY